MRIMGERNTPANVMIRSVLREARGRVALVIFCRVIQSAMYLLFVLLSRNLIDSAVNGDAPGMMRAAVFLAGTVLLRIALNYFLRLLSGTTYNRACVKLRGRIYAQMLQKEQQSLSEYHSAVLLERIMEDLPKIVHYPLEAIPSFIGSIAGLMGAVWTLFLINSLLPAALLAAGAALLGVGRAFQKKSKANYKAFSEATEQSYAYYQESFANSLMLKVFRALPQATERARVFEGEVYAKWKKWFLYNQVLGVGVGAFFQTGYLGTMLFCAALLLKGGVSFGAVTATLQLVNEIQEPFSDVGDLLSARYQAQAAAERILEISRLPAERDAGSVDGWALYAKMRSIELTDLSFDYDEDSPVLVGANAHLEKGDFVVITGPSGMGKSTLLQLLLGVYENYSGKLELALTDGERLRLDESTRALFSYVPQKHMVFSGTVRDNLCFLCGQAGDDEIWRAARLADAEDFLRRLPEGLDTKLGETGQGLSEGQTQRLAIARALLKRAPILVLDEATSALDEDTEEKVLKNIRTLDDITLLIISHRRAAYAICDREWRVRDGFIEGRNLRRDN